jgi:hypothetical protein
VVHVRRLWAVFLCLVLLGGNAAVCAGWAPTPEARKACCESGMCPMMHKEERRASLSEQGRGQNGRQLDDVDGGVTELTHHPLCGTSTEPDDEHLRGGG